MHFIGRSNRRLHKSEKVLAGITLIVLIVTFISLIANAPPTNKPPQKSQEKYFTIVLTEHEYSKLKEVIKTYHKELPSSINEVYTTSSSK